jgi:hypothetical protein
VAVTTNNTDNIDNREWLTPLDSGAMTSLDLSGNGLGIEGAKHVAEALKVHMLLCSCGLFWHRFHVHLSSSSIAVVCHYPQDMGGGALLYIETEQLVAFYAEHNPANVANVDAVLQRYSAQKIIDSCQEKYGMQPMTRSKAKGAILSANLLKNGIGVEQARALVIFLNEHPTLKSLCGNKGDETELDMSSKMKGAEDAIMLVGEIDNGATTSLNLGENDLGLEGAKVVTAFLPKCTYVPYYNEPLSPPVIPLDWYS